MQNFTTRKGHRLEVLESPSPWKEDKVKQYMFILHEAREHGENITILNKLLLASPDFWISKYVAEN